jgi:hypothetical protein
VPSLFHDENSNGKQIGYKLYGHPRKGVTVSNSAKGHFGPPKFDAAAFRFSGARLEFEDHHSLSVTNHGRRMGQSFGRMSIEFCSPPLHSFCLAFFNSMNCLATAVERRL